MIKNKKRVLAYNKSKGKDNIRYEWQFIVIFETLGCFFILVVMYSSELQYF